MDTTKSSFLGDLEARRPLRKLDLRALPATLTDKGSWLGLGVLLIGAVVVALTVLMLVWLLQAEPPAREDDRLIQRLSFVVPLAMLPLGLVFLFYGLKRASRTTVISVDHEAVDFSQKSLFGTTQWSEPLANYEGLLLRDEMRPYERTHIKVYLLELHHPRPERTIPICEAYEPEEPVRHWEAFCRSLNLPALELDGDAVIRKESEDLEKPVSNLIEQGKDEVEFDPTRPPPRGLRVQVADDALVVTVLTRKPCSSSAYAYTLCWFGFALLVIIAWGLIGRVLGTLMIVVQAVVVIMDRLTKERVKIRKGAIHLLYKTPWAESKGQVLEVSQIKSVTIGEDSHEVRLRTEKTVLAIGGGLSEEALTWLRNCIKAAATQRAPSERH